MVLTVPLMKEILYGISSDLPCMEQRELRHDQYMVLLLAGHMRSAGAAKPKGVQALYLRACLTIRNFNKNPHDPWDTHERENDRTFSYQRKTKGDDII